jgi:hypothetical protein
MLSGSDRSEKMRYDFMDMLLYILQCGRAQLRESVSTLQISVINFTTTQIMAGKVLSLVTSIASLVLGISATTQPYCKPIPGSSDWPLLSEWQALNSTVLGRLIAPVPPGLVCQKNSSLYNVQACGNVYQQWANSSWHASDPFTGDYNDEACLPSNLAPCSATAYPAYVVNASDASHVQAAVKFAKRTGVRLIMKGTGHDIAAR